MKKRLSALIMAAMLLFTGCSAGGSSDSSGGGLSSDGKAFHDAADVAKDMGLGWNLGNTMEAYDAQDCEKITYEWIPVKGSNTPSDYETCWGAPVTTQEMIDGVRDVGFKTVRIPVFWGNMMKNDGSWTIDPAYLGRVKEIVDYCLKDDLYAVVNIHHFDEFVIRRNGIEGSRDIFKTLWTQIADYFKDYPEKLIFEGYNEYLGGDVFNDSGELTPLSDNDGYLLTNTMNQIFVSSVRETGGNNAERVLIVSGYWTNIDKTTSSRFLMPTDTIENRLMVSVHYVDNSMYWQNRIGSQDWLDYTDGQIAELDHAFTEQNIPVFLGETTSRYPASNFAGDAQYQTSSECLEVILDKLTEHGFVPVLWDVTDNFYSRSDCKIKDSDDEEVIKKIAKKISK